MHSKSYHPQDQLETTTNTTTSMSESRFDLEVIYSYTRKQAIEDGVLIDLADANLGELSKLAAQLGYTYPIAMTSTAFNRYVIPNDKAKAMGQSSVGRLWDILWILRIAIKWSQTDQDTLRFRFHCQLWDGSDDLKLDWDDEDLEEIEPKLYTLKCVVGPDDDGKPCLTIMLPNED